MLRSVSIALFGVILAATTAMTAAQERQSVLVGVWKVTEVSVRRPGEEWVKATPGASLYIFTKKHYSYTFAPTPQEPERDDW